jgi:hypothetical protein
VGPLADGHEHRQRGREEQDRRRHGLGLDQRERRHDDQREPEADRTLYRAARRGGQDEPSQRTGTELGDHRPLSGAPDARAR